jgi:hypothetical protein
MTIGFVYWLLLLIGLVMGVFYRFWPPPAQPLFWPASGVYLLVLLILLGIAVFGWPIRA